MAVENEDRRITRSKRALRDALIALMEERGLDGFTVNDLCERADLNRGTFYNHFKGKDDLLATMEAEVMDELACVSARMREISLPELLKCRVAKQPLPFLIDLFDSMRAQGDFLHAVLGANGDPAFGPQVRDYVRVNLVEALLHERYRESGDPFVEYYTSFYASAYLGVILRWIETGMRESSEDMARIAMRLLFIKPGDPIKL